MSQKLPVNDRNWVENISGFNEDFIKSYNYESDQGYFVDADVQYHGDLDKLHNDLPFLPEIMKIVNVKELVANLHYKTECYTYKKCKASIKTWISIEKTCIESLNLIKKLG